jgi:hypothetical protein
MRKEIKLLVVLILVLSAANSNAQSTAAAVATATIVTPVTLSSDQSQSFEAVKAPSVFDLLFSNQNIYLPGKLAKISSYNSTITAADFVINAGRGDVYAITIPQKIFLANASGTERMTADILPGTASWDDAGYNGKKHLVINAGLQIKNGQTPGRYASQAFDVTVNFN